MNMVALVGNVASKPDTKVTSGGKTVGSFRLAVSRVGGEQADFFTVVAWERQAQICDEYLTVGRKIAIEGRLLHSSWRNEKNEARSRVEVVAHRVELLGPRPQPKDDEQPIEVAAGASSGDDPFGAASSEEDPFDAAVRESDAAALVV